MPEEKTPKKPAENADKQQKKSPETRTKNNEKAAQKLTEATKQPEKKKEKSWKIGLGTTKVATDDRSMEVSTTGIKLENKKKSLELTLGAATVTEVVKPGAFPEQRTMPGFSLKKRF